jgi:rhodanese-related sulfurtransferase
VSFEQPVLQLTVGEARALLDSGGATALDVREPYEWEAGRLPGSLWIPMGQLAGRLDELPTGPLVVVCRVGSRSGHVAGALAARGYDARNLIGGLEMWHASGYPLEPEGGTVA